MSQTERDRPSALRAARERTRAEITREIVDTARRHQATDAASGPSLRAIAREPGGSPAAVYRYVAESVRRRAEQLGIAPSHSGTAPDARQLRPDGAAQSAVNSGATEDSTSPIAKEASHELSPSRRSQGTRGRGGRTGGPGGRLPRLAP